MSSNSTASTHWNTNKVSVWNNLEKGIFVFIRYNSQASFSSKGFWLEKNTCIYFGKQCLQSVSLSEIQSVTNYWAPRLIFKYSIWLDNHDLDQFTHKRSYWNLIFIKKEAWPTLLLLTHQWTTTSMSRKLKLPSVFHVISQQNSTINTEQSICISLQVYR